MGGEGREPAKAGTASMEGLWDLYTPLGPPPEPEPEAAEVTGVGAELEDGTQVLLVNRIPDGQARRKKTARGQARRAARWIGEVAGAIALMLVAYLLYNWLVSGSGPMEAAGRLLGG